jgi:hypothetical protein
MRSPLQYTLRSSRFPVIAIGGDAVAGEHPARRLVDGAPAHPLDDEGAQALAGGADSGVPTGRVHPVWIHRFAAAPAATASPAQGCEQDPPVSIFPAKPSPALGDERAPCQLGIAISQSLRLACLRLECLRLAYIRITWDQ